MGPQGPAGQPWEFAWGEGSVQTCTYLQRCAGANGCNIDGGWHLVGGGLQLIGNHPGVSIQQSFPHADHHWYSEIYNNRAGGGSAEYRRTIICARRTNQGIAEASDDPIAIELPEQTWPLEWNNHVGTVGAAGSRRAARCNDLLPRLTTSEAAEPLRGRYTVVAAFRKSAALSRRHRICTLTWIFF